MRFNYPKSKVPDLYLLKLTNNGTMDTSGGLFDAIPANLDDIGTYSSHGIKIK